MEWAGKWFVPDWVQALKSLLSILHLQSAFAISNSQNDSSFIQQKIIVIDEMLGCNKKLYARLLLEGLYREESAHF